MVVWTADATIALEPLLWLLELPPPAALCTALFKVLGEWLLGLAEPFECFELLELMVTVVAEQLGQVLVDRLAIRLLFRLSLLLAGKLWFAFDC